MIVIGYEDVLKMEVGVMLVGGGQEGCRRWAGSSESGNNDTEADEEQGT